MGSKRQNQKEYIVKELLKCIAYRHDRGSTEESNLKKPAPREIPVITLAPSYWAGGCQRGTSCPSKAPSSHNLLHFFLPPPPLWAGDCRDPNLNEGLHMRFSPEIVTKKEFTYND
jgi:hypothetical protein